MSQKDLKSPIKVKRTRNGRIFIFSDKNSRDIMLKTKDLFTELGLEDSIAEIRIDGKPHLRQVMKNASGGAQECIQIFFNSTYFGDYKTLVEKKDTLKELLEKILNDAPGELYNVYKRQNDLLDVNPPVCYFPPPFPRNISTLLKFSNKGENLVAFKIKSKQPKKFAVKPREGLLQPGESVLVEITITKDQEVPKEDDKFKIECVKIVDVKTISEKNAIADAFTLYEKAIVGQMIDCVCAVPTGNIKVTQFNDKVVVEMLEEKVVLTNVDTPIGPSQKELDQIEKEKQDKERVEKENLEKMEREKAALEKENQERIVKMEQERLLKEKQEKERLQREKDVLIEKERLEKERLEKQKMDQEIKDRLEKERLSKLEAEKAKVVAPVEPIKEIKKEESTVSTPSNDAQVNNLKNTLVTKESELQVALAKVTSTADQLKTTQEKLVIAETQVKSLSTEKSNLQRSKEEAVNDAANLKDEKQKLIAQLSQAQQDVTTRQSDIKDLKDKMIDSKNRVIKLENEVKVLQTTLSNTTNENLRLVELEITKAKELKETIKSMESGFSKKEQDLKNELSQKEKKISGLEIDLTRLKSEIEKNLSFQKEKESMTPENKDSILSEKQEEIVRLNREIFDLKKLLDETSHVSNEMQEKVMNLQTEKESMTTMIRDFEGQVERLTAKNLVLNQQVASQEREIKTFSQNDQEKDIVLNKLTKLEQELIEKNKNENESKLKLEAMSSLNNQNAKKMEVDQKKIADLQQFEEIAKKLNEQITKLKESGIKVESKDDKKELKVIYNDNYWVHVILSFLFFIFGYFFH